MDTWTPARISALTELWATHSAAIIAEMLGGVSRNAVIGKARRLALPPKMDDADKRRRLISRQRRNPTFRPRVKPVRVPEPPHEFLGILITQLTTTTCRYPKGDGPFLFCGQQVMPGSAWCPHCHRIATEPPKRRAA